MSNIKSLTNILPLAIILLGLVSYNFMSAAWTPAPASPPANNAAAPINVGTSTQSFQSAHGQLTFDRVNALTQMRSQEYCDLSGNVCKSAASLLGLPTCSEGQTIKFVSGAWVCAAEGSGSSCNIQTTQVSVCELPGSWASKNIACPAGYAKNGPVAGEGQCSTNNETYTQYCIRTVCS